MNRHKILGAVSFPVFLLMWSSAAGLFVAELKSADAMLLPVRAPVIEPLQVDIADPRAWEAALAELARTSPVMNGDWQPPGASTLPEVPARSPHPVPQSRQELEPAVPAEPAQPPSLPAEPAPPPSPPAVAVRTVVAAADSAGAVGVPADLKTPVAEPAAPVVRAATGRVQKSASRGVNVLALRKADARASLRAGQFAAAYHRLRADVGEARHDSEYLGLLALAALRVGSAAEALVLYQHLVTLEPDSNRWRAGMAFAGERLTLDAGVGHQQPTLGDGINQVT